MALNWLSSRAGRSSVHAERASATSAPVVAPDTPPDTEPDTPAWQDMVRQLSEEVMVSLNVAAEHLGRLQRLEPGLVRSLTPAGDAVERARQASLAAHHVLRLWEDPPTLRPEVLNLADVAHAALTARGEWFERRGLQVRHGFAEALVHTDASLLYQLVDELLLWTGQLHADLAINVDRSRSTGRPRLHVISLCKPSTVAESAWRGIRWTLWHQLARAANAQTRLDIKGDLVRVTISLPEATSQELARAAEDSVGPSSVSAVIQGCRVMIVSASAQRRAQCLQALAGYGLILDSVEDMEQARQQALRHLSDAVVYDGTVAPADIERLRAQLLEQTSTNAAFIQIHDDSGVTDFHASTIGSVSTGHVSAGALRQSLGPALVFELCKVL